VIGQISLGPLGDGLLKYLHGAAFDRQHQLVDVLLSDITDSGEVLEASELV
jgi:hypothetical protein